MLGSVRLRGHADANLPLARLAAFRAELHACFARRADALFELADALLCAPAIPSLAHLSLQAVHRRGWGSSYAALAHGRLDTEQLRDLLARQPLDGGLPIYAVDATTWPRCDAETSPQRGLYYHPPATFAGQPIVAGWCDQWIAQLGFARDSWTAPVDATRLHPGDNHNRVAVTQIRALLRRLPAGGPVPLFVFDAGYDPTGLVLGLAQARVALLCGCALAAAWTTTRHPARQGPPAGHAGTAPNSTPPTPPPGRPRP